METSKRHEHKPPPPNCIWMDAGVIAYFLCDKNFECEYCPLDMVMRQRHTPAMTESSAVSLPVGERMEGKKSLGTEKEYTESALNSFFEPFVRGGFPADRKYHSGHLWVLECGDGQRIVGVDEVGVRLLGSVQSVVMPQVPLHIMHNVPFAWLIHRDGAIALHAPLEGVIVETNPRLVEDPALLHRDPYGEGWIVRVAESASGVTRTFLQTADHYDILVRAELHSLRRQFMKQLQKATAAGVTLFDGGMRIEALQEMIGSKTYLSLINRLFSP